MVLMACDNKPKKFLNIGHRGAMGHVMENTLPSIQKALDLKVDMIEIDVFVCKSGEVVVFHDEILDSLSSSTGKIEFILRAKKKGYFIRFFFVCTNSPTINASRIANRVLRGGHDVPITKIISRYSKSIANGFYLSSEVDRSYFYDNSLEDKEPKLLFRAKNGKISKEYRKIAPWAVPILEKLKA
jgi:predicted ABC-type ATPase